MPSTSIDCDVIAFRAKWVLVPEENASKQEAKASASDSLRTVLLKISQRARRAVDQSGPSCAIGQRTTRQLSAEGL